MAELLVELLSEEIPARMQKRAAEDLKRLVCKGVKEAGLDYTMAETYSSPRRLALVIDGIPTRQPDVSEQRKGPGTNAPEQAIKGFLGSVGLEITDQCEKREIKGREFYFAVIEKKGRETVDVMGEIISSSLSLLVWPKSMRWGDHGVRWVRPLRSLVCLFDAKVVSTCFGQVVSSDTTVGHRFLAPKPFNVHGFADYKSKLAHARVMLDGDERSRVIIGQAEKLAADEGLSLKPDKALLAEVVGLVEWPVVLIGAIDKEFTDLPQEVLVTSMRYHQKYFSLLDGDGNMASRFIVVANTEASDGGRAIIAGNERVLRARLSDARFFFDSDCKNSLESRLGELENLVFHARLGIVSDKAVRVSELAHALAGYVGAERELAKRAGLLCKADLATGMVGEFPELQGIMGRYYALNDGENEDVAEAIARHYSPLGPNDDCPDHPLSVIVSMADKIDTLVGFFSIDEKPTGSKDPFALRRAALGVIRLIIENRLEIPLLKIFRVSQDTHNAADGKIADELLDFFADRLKVHLREGGTRHDLISAVFAVEMPGGGREDNLLRLLSRVSALSDFLGTEDGANMLVAWRRAANILRIEEKKDNLSYNGVADETLLSQDQERALFEGLAEADKKGIPALRDEKYGVVMAALAELRGPVDAFFDEVTVNCDQPETRVNRLLLLSQIRSSLGGVADFSKIEG